MTYRSSVTLYGLPPFNAFARPSPLALTLRRNDFLPEIRVAVGDISAVLWDVGDKTDEDGDRAYVLILRDEMMRVYSKRAAADFLCWLFDSLEPQRDWQTRCPSGRCRVDFAARAAWRCVDPPAPTAGECGVALVPAHVTAVLGSAEAHTCAVQLRGRAKPLILRTDLPFDAFARWLFAEAASS